MTNDEVLKALHQVELDVLLDIDAFCCEHQIAWWLDSGSALGAARDGGFIPWDDDVDIAMPRADYDRFCKLVSDGLLPGCILHNTHNTPGFAPLFSKICVEGTRFETEETRAAGYEQGIFIDVFPYDETFKDASKSSLQFRQAATAQKRSYLYHSSNINVPHGGLLGTIERIGCLVLHWVERARVKNPAQYQNLYDALRPNAQEASGELCPFSWSRQVSFPISILMPTVKLEFEGHMLPVPADYDRYLTMTYGDWHQVPPVDQRHTHLPLLIQFPNGDVWDSAAS